MAKRYGSTYALRLDELIDEVGAKLEEDSGEETSLVDESDSAESYADKVRASVKPTGAAAYPHLVLKRMVEGAKSQSGDDEEEGDEEEPTRYGSTTAKRLDDWITLTASKLKEGTTDQDSTDNTSGGGLEAEARARQQAHAYGTTEYQRRVWLDMVENAEKPSNGEQGGSNGQEQQQAEEVV